MQKDFSCQKRVKPWKPVNQSVLLLRGLMNSVFVGIKNQSLACAMLRFRRDWALSAKTIFSMMKKGSWLELEGFVIDSG